MSGEHTHPDLATAQAATDNTTAALLARVAALEAAPPGTGTAVAEPGVIDVAREPGATFDDQLASALTRAAAATHKPTLRLPHGAVTWNRTIRAFTGLKIIGAGGGASVEQPRSNNPYATLVNYRGTDPTKPMLLFPNGQTFGVTLANMAINGTSSSTIVNSESASAVAWTSVFENLGMANQRHAFGTPAQKFLITACTFGGSHNNIANSRGDAVTVGGSDNELWMGGTCLMDSPTNLNTGVGSLFHASSLQKTNIGGLYITCEGTPTGIRVTGGSSTAPVTFWGPRVEGRNAGQPSTGPVIRVEGGSVSILAPWLAYSLTETVRVAGGDVLIDGATFAPATNTPSTTPAVAQSGGTLRVVNARRSPLVTRTGGTLTHDGTIRTV
jgi:hypothetical protein